MKKYHPLGAYLIKQSEVAISLTFQEIEKILGFALPYSAYCHRAWWANSLSHPQACSWLNVGWRVSHVKVEKQTVSLKRLLILTISKVVDGSEELSLKGSIDAVGVVLVLSGPEATANTAYSWQQIAQMLIKENPHLFGNLTRQPMHHIFPEMLAKMGYNVLNWETGESWKARQVNALSISVK
jgi:hypothetical protein